MSASAALLLAVLGLAWGLRAGPPVNLVVITLDTTRADRLSPYGFMNVSLPALERLAREGVVFDQATSVAPLTLPAHASLFTGLLPPHHGVRDNADAPLADARTTLAEMLRARGFGTGAFVGSPVLNPERGLKQGFDEYRPVTRQRRGDAVVDDALAWIGAGTSPMFAWIHLYDAHRPYDPPQPYGSVHAHDPYVGEIAFADAQVGRLVDALDARRLLDRTVLIVAGDHGESLGEHGERDHGVFIYENVLRVPLMIRAPGLRPGRVGAVVRLTDVLPTALDLLHVPGPPLDGTSLATLMTGRADGPELDAYAESMYPERFAVSALRALRRGRYKLIEAPRPELYDLLLDPFESTSLYGTHVTVARAMEEALRSIADGDTIETDSATPPLEVRERLAALGYVTGARTRGAGHQDWPDPKDCVRRILPCRWPWPWPRQGLDTWNPGTLKDPEDRQSP